VLFLWVYGIVQLEASVIPWNLFNGALLCPTVHKYLLRSAGSDASDAYTAVTVGSKVVSSRQIHKHQEQQHKAVSLSADREVLITSGCV